MNSSEIRRRFINFFVKRKHTEIPSASLIPEEVSVTQRTLFNGAGMQPLIPYLLGKEHPRGKRLVDIQKCIRTGDIDDIGDNRHFTFFEMMGNWSLGDYFKEEAIPWSFEFLTSKEEGLGLNKNNLYVTCFEGDENAPKDTESAEIWKKVGIPENRIYFLGADDNWWSAGDNGPCGPDTEMFYDHTGTVGDLSKEEFLKTVKEERVIEIWNDVFMEYEKRDGKIVGKLPNKNVDTGAGLERMTAVINNKKTAYDTDIFEHIFKELRSQIHEPKNISIDQKTKSERIVADHLRAATFMIADGIQPSNTDRGYVLRRLLRRAILNADKIGITNQELGYICTQGVINSYVEVYPELELKRTLIHNTVLEEENKFRETLKTGLKEFEKGTDAFTLFSSYGFPLELTKELAKEKGIEIDEKGFQEKFKAHQEVSKEGSEQKFKGGLANHNPQTIKLHTAHHLLLSALQSILGKTVKQKGSNITDERLRIDFLFDRKMTDEEKRKVEDLVNEYIKKDLSVVKKEIPKAEAEKLGAEMEFGAKYGDIVSVYFIEDGNGTVVSKEFCGGPHVENTRELGHFKIIKEEAVSAGVRRIKAVLVEN